LTTALQRASLARCEVTGSARSSCLRSDPHIVKPIVNPGALDSVSIFIRWLKAAMLAGDPQKLARHAMITATWLVIPPGRNSG